MILNEKNKKPKITFGLGRTKAEINLGESITIYQSEIFIDDDYNISISGLGTSKVVSLNKIVFTPTESGLQSLNINVSQKRDRTKIKSSNVIQLNVNEP